MTHVVYKPDCPCCLCQPHQPTLDSGLTGFPVLQPCVAFSAGTFVAQLTFNAWLIFSGKTPICPYRERCLMCCVAHEAWGLAQAV